MKIQLAGLTFQTNSPSHFELLSRNELHEGDSVSIAFDGVMWRIDYCQPGRLPISRVFSSRDAAVRLIADRRPGA